METSLFLKTWYSESTHLTPYLPLFDGKRFEGSSFSMVQSLDSSLILFWIETPPYCQCIH